jgi:hypothetical protein
MGAVTVSTLLFPSYAGAILAVAASALAALFVRDVPFSSSVTLVAVAFGRFGFNVTITVSVINDCDSSAVAIDSGGPHSEWW